MNNPYMPKDLRKLIAKYCIEDARYNTRSMIRRFDYYAGKIEYDPLIRATWIDCFISACLFPMEFYQCDWEEYGNEILNLLKKEKELIDSVKTFSPVFIKDSKGAWKKSGYWRIRQSLMVYLAFAYFYCDMPGECKSCLEEALDETKKNVSLFFKKLEKNTGSFEIKPPNRTMYLGGEMEWLEPLHWIAMETDYDVFSRIVFPYYQDLWEYLEWKSRETERKPETDKLLYHACCTMEDLADKACESIQFEISDDKKVIQFQSLWGQYHDEYRYSHLKLPDLRSAFFPVKGDPEKIYPVGKETLLQPDGELTVYERKLLEDAIAFSDVIITDGNIGIGLSYKPRERGDYAPVTMGYVEETYKAGILDHLRNKKYVYEDAALARYLRIFDNPYWEVTAELYLSIAEIYAKYYATKNARCEIVKLSRWKMNHDGQK